MQFSKYFNKIYNFVLDDDECIFPLLDRAQLTATTSLPERGPNNAMLNGKKDTITTSSLGLVLLNRIIVQLYISYIIYSYMIVVVCCLLSISVKSVVIYIMHYICFCLH